MSTNKYELLVYYINKNAYKPFLEFMLYKSNEDDTFYFPNFSQKLIALLVLALYFF